MATSKRDEQAVSTTATAATSNAILLNDNQLAAVTASPDKALLVVAGPGSGKTRVIVERVKHLISHFGIKPSEILCLTFSDKAAEEMRTRIEKEANTAEVETCTFHSFCLAVLEESILDTGVSFKSGLISRANQLVWGLKNIDSFGFEHIEVGNNASQVIEALIDGISAFRDELVSPVELREFIDRKKKQYEADRQTLLLAQKTEEMKEKVPSGRLGASSSSAKMAKFKARKISAAEEDLEEKLAFLNKLSDLYKVYERYEQHKRHSSLIDFDDMVRITIDTFKGKKDVLKRYQQRYAYVLVDEFQDNNYAQLELVKLLCPQGNVTAVGDDDQSIYRFRGAFDSIFGDFQESYNDNNITIVKLERNYRSTRQIVRLAKKLLDPVPNRVQKSLYSENEEGDRTIVAMCATDLAEIDYVVNKIKNELVGREITRRGGDGTSAAAVVSKITYRDIAILSRRRLEGLKFAKALKAHGIPCTFVGESRIFSMPVVRDMLAYLRVAADPLDNGIEIARILLAHGVPEQDLKIINHAAKAKARELVKRLDGENGNGKYSSRADDTDNNRNYGTDFVYDEIEEIATSSNSISGQLRTKSLVVDVYNQIKKILSLRDKRTVGQFVHEVLMSHTDIYKRTIKYDSNESTRDRLVLHEFLDIVREFESTTKNGTLNDLLAHIEMMSDFDIELRYGQDDLDSVTVTTIHQSKGREFPIVFVVDVADRRLPVIFKEKKFYCPSELAHGLRNRDKDEKEIFLEEERRLLYVAMTRAQHQLFLTLAEIYGDNTTKTKASQFLLELDVENNPLVSLVEYDLQGQALPLVVAEDRIEQLKHEYQMLATKFVSQMQLKSAIEKIVELAMIEHVRLGKSLDTFELKAIISDIVVADRAKIEAQLREERPALIDKDNIHFSASALKTYKDCPLKYKFQHVLEVPSGGKTYFDLGTAVHSVVEVLTRRQIEEKGYLPTKDDAIKILDHYWVSSSYQSITAEQEDRVHAEKMFEFFVLWCAERNGMGCTPFEAEKYFEIEIAGKKVIGFIDRIDLTPSGNYEVFDYKTGKSTLHGNTVRSDIQMNLYSLAIEKLYGKLPQSANLLYLQKEKKLSYDAEQDAVAKSKEEMISLIEGILKEMFDPKPDYNTCKFCDYQSICDAKELEED
jgi:DNA helicase II / ATP-dependent DNA helicase PcrA